MITTEITGAGGSNGGATADATVLDAPLTGTSGNEIAGIEGITTGTVLLGTFVDANPNATAADYTAGGGSITVNWGDGTGFHPLVAANLTALGSPAGVTWSVSAANIYKEEGTYSYSVVVMDDGGATTIIAGSAIIADAPLKASLAQPSVNTVEAVVYPIPEFGTPLFTGNVAEFTDANPAAPINDFRATIDWGDGTAQTAGAITQPMGLAGTPFFVSGSHTYATSGVNGGVGHDPITIYINDVGGSDLTVFNTANVADSPMSVSGILNPASDSGKSGTDRITNVSQPNFYGTVYVAGTNTPKPYSHVTLYANGTPVGNTQAGSDGTWSITSNLLAQGAYAITAVAVDQFGQTVSSTATIVADLVVDTTPPVITSLSFNRFDATLTVTFQDNLSGMDLASIINSAFYHVSAKPLARNVPVPKLILPTSIDYTPGASPSDPVTVYAVFNKGRTFRGGKYEVVINSGTDDSGIQDVAGNALDGNFYGSFPTGDGLAGGSFVADISTFHRVVLPFVPIASGYVPPIKGIDPDGPPRSGKSKSQPKVQTKLAETMVDQRVIKTLVRNSAPKAMKAAHNAVSRRTASTKVHDRAVLALIAASKNGS